MSGDGIQGQYDQLRKRFAELKPAYQKAAREKEQAYVMHTIQMPTNQRGGT